MQKIGIFGGSFNPIHCGHLSMAHLACEQFHLDALFLVPTKNHPFEKETLTVSAEQRVKMVELAITKEPLFHCYRGEIDRDGVSYAIDTIEQLQSEYPNAELFYLIGEDNLPTFTKWHRYSEILENVTLIVASRPGYSYDETTLLCKPTFFPSPEWGLSSSTIRKYLAEGFSCSYLIPNEVQKYCLENKVYTK